MSEKRTNRLCTLTRRYRVARAQTHWNKANYSVRRSWGAWFFNQLSRREGY